MPRARFGVRFNHRRGPETMGSLLLRMATTLVLTMALTVGLAAMLPGAARAQTGGAQTGGAQTGGARTGGARTGGAQPGSAQPEGAGTGSDGFEMFDMGKLLATGGVNQVEGAGGG